ncbi:Protein of unknown function DUF155 domain-containing protein [Rozella allomycis CSF55]|uniref:DUF155 domain-containing protein n=1 Tax=Rozella allomycis (strain CSF55) TaxID=988480 RepID=A0A075AV27_ROZAC|nr:Protein of unknown function DUF155 domain-containing protein [Rozella allomycis CSF55]|eukprot:EPZ34020.1 Protein of unknown function DUF155 domain-containing protein [Rozella allomycis CSF55]
MNKICQSIFSPRVFHRTHYSLTSIPKIYKPAVSILSLSTKSTLLPIRLYSLPKNKGVNVEDVDEQDITSQQLPIPTFKTKTPKKRRIPNPVESTDQLKMVKAFGTALEYNFETLLPYLQRNFILSPQYFNDIYHIKLLDPMTKEETQGEVFYFKAGSMIMWDVDDATSMRLLREIKEHEIDSYPEIETEELTYKPSNNGTSGLSGDSIVLCSNAESAEIFRNKLALSHGISNSVKLGALEILLEKYIESVREIPEMLKAKNRITLNRYQALAKIGELLSFRANLNLHSEFLGTPDVYWSEPNLEELYNKVSRVLDLKSRTMTLNRKLDYANEIVQVLQNHLRQKHTDNMEWAIIILISIECVFSLIGFLK